jgi:hypothetical protein
MAAKKPPKIKEGPYRAPACRVGDRLVCRISGEQTVTGFTAAPVPWPYFRSRYRRQRLFLCGDLERALERESARAFADLFRVSEATVRKWRLILKIKPSSGRGWPRKLTDDQVDEIRARAATGETQCSIARAYGISNIYASVLVRKLYRATRKDAVG